MSGGVETACYVTTWWYTGDMKDKNGVEFETGCIFRYLDQARYLCLADGGVIPATGEPPGWIRPWDWRQQMALGGNIYEIVMRADGSDPRQPELYDGIWARKEVEMMCDAIQSAAIALAKPLPRASHELYAEFRKVVEETVRREAPKASVLTDLLSDGFYADVSSGRHSVVRRVETGNSRAYLEGFVLAMCHVLRETIARDALK